MLNSNENNSSSTEWSHLFQSYLKEQRLTRRWNIFFKLIFVGLLGYFFILPFTLLKLEMNQPILTTSPHTALINVIGEIDSQKEANADSTIEALEKAFDNKNVKGVVLRINSPGGSAVQARQIFDAIQVLKKMKPAIKIYAAIEDMGTSAAYLIASACDEIYSDQTSIVGSIGVILDSFGFTEIMNKVGVERRLYTSGKNKGMLDPFTPRNLEQDHIVQSQIELVHKAFIENVRFGRKERLRETPDIFSGRFWAGVEAHKLGLIDGFGDVRYIASQLIKQDNVVDYTTGLGLLDRLSHRIGTYFGQTISLKLDFANKGIR
ncbi:MAG: sppA [Francisellaceae bacterium]|nr:sppA [Francisellaceae bacterium]